MRVVTWTVGVTTCKFQQVWRVKNTHVVLVMFMFLAHTPDLAGSLVLHIPCLAKGVDHFWRTCGESTDSKSRETTCFLCIVCKRTSLCEEQSRRDRLSWCGGLFVSWVRQSFAVIGAGNIWMSCIKKKRAVAEVLRKQGTSLVHPGNCPPNLEGHAQFSENCRDVRQVRK